MFEVWLEDSTSGARLLSNLLNSYFGKKNILVKFHDGNGNNVPYLTKNGGILYDLRKNRNNKNLIALFIDVVYDNVDVVSVLQEIDEELQFHTHVYLLNSYCFEHNMLSYTDLSKYGGSLYSGYDNDRYCFLKSIHDNVFDIELIDKSLVSTSFKSYLDKHITVSGEKVAKMLLGNGTCKHNILTNKLQFEGVRIVGGDLGVCWTCDCCKYANSIKEYRCDKAVRGTKDSKYTNLINKSTLIGHFKQIENMIVRYVNSFYSAGGSGLEKKETNRIQSLLQQGKWTKEFYMRALSLISEHGYWNYVSITNV